MRRIIPLQQGKPVKPVFSFLYPKRFILKVLVITIVFNLINMMTMTVDKIYAQSAVVLIRPVENQMVYANKPEMECRILVPYDKASLYIEFDYTDMTALVKITETGFTLRPVQVVAPGEHTLKISFTDESKEEFTESYRFTTRHSKTFEQAYSKNNITAVYTNILKRLDDAKTMQLSDWKLESNVDSRNMLSEGPWELRFNTNIQYFNQELPVEEPLEKGLNVADYVFTGQYKKKAYSFNAAIGDVTIDETRNTMNYLSRRGGTVGAELGPLYFSGFVVRSDLTSGLDGEYGLKFDDNDHIYGGTGGLKLFKNRLDIKTVYVRGGESSMDESYGIWPAPGGSKGEVYGVEAKTNFFEEKFKTGFEWDRSDYDEDTADSLGSESDKAYLAKIDGVINILTYEALYEYTGPDYHVPGNDCILNDREGFSVMNRLSFETQSIEARYARHNDNVENDPTYARINSYNYGFDYALYAVTWLPIDLSGSRAVQDSSNEPEQTFETKSYTDIYSGNITYVKNSWSLGLKPIYSQIDDKTPDDYDTSSKSLTLFFNYENDRFSLSPSITRNRFKDHTTYVKTDTNTYYLSFSANIIAGLKIEGAAEYIKEYDSNDSMDQDDFNADIQLSYNFTSPIKGILSPGVILRATHKNINDEIADTDNKETIIYFLLTANLDLSF